MVAEEGLGSAEVEVQVKAHGHVVHVIGDIESHHFLVLLAHALHEGEDEAAIGHARVLHLEFLATAIDEGLFADIVTISHLEAYALAVLVGRRVEGAGTHQHADHIEDALRGAVVVVADITFPVDEALLELHLAATGIGVPYLVHIVALALERALAVVEGLQLGRDVADEGVAHHEELVGSLAAARNQVAAIGIATIVLGLLDAEVGCAGFDPDEFPVEVQLVVQFLARVEGGVHHRTLGLR